MDKPIPEAVRVLVAELDEYLRGCPDPNKTSPKWMVREPSRLLWRCRDAILSLTAAQQQGQAVAGRPTDEVECSRCVPGSAGPCGFDCAQLIGTTSPFAQLPTAPPPSVPVGVEGLVVAARKLRDSARGMDDGNRWVPGAVFKQFSKAVTAALATQHQEPTT